MSSTFRSLKYYNARLFFSGLAVSNVGTWLQMTAMSLLVYRLTGEATAVGPQEDQHATEHGGKNADPEPGANRIEAN